MSTENIRIERATAQDVPLILKFIRSLADFEQLAHVCVATEEDLRKTLFGEKPGAEVLIAYLGDEPAGFSLFFHNYSIFLAGPGLYLEDLFVLPHFRVTGEWLNELAAL